MQNTTEQQTFPALIENEGKAYTFNNGTLLYGYQPERRVMQRGTPWVGWRGSLIPYATFQTIKAFFRWANEEHKSEALVRLYYNEEKSDWLAWAPPQRGIGLTVKTIDDDKNMAQAEAFLGYVLTGTGHSHCNSSAFQSGTDANDESPVNGIHFTIGKVAEARVDLHARAVLNGNVYTCNLINWIDIPEELAALENDPRYKPYLPMLYDSAMTAQPDASLPFPQQWKDNYHHGYGGGYQYNNGPHSGPFSQSTRLPGGTGSERKPLVIGGASNGEVWVWENGVAKKVSAKEQESFDRSDEADVELSALLQFGSAPSYNTMCDIADKLTGKLMTSMDLPMESEIKEVLEKYKLPATWFKWWVNDNASWLESVSSYHNHNSEGHFGLGC